MDHVFKRLKAIEDELSVRNLPARFTDAVNQRDKEAFRNLWAEDGVWEIGPPFAFKAVGVHEISELFERLLKPKTLFIQLTHSGVVTFTGPDEATGRYTERERGRGEGDYYENLAVYHDDYVRIGVTWKFKRRFYDYRFVDTSAFTGDIVPPAA